MSDTETKRSSRAELWRKLGPAGALGIAWASLPAIGGFVLLGSIGVISDFLREQGDLGIVIYVACFILAAGFGLLPTYAQAVLGGWVFGIAIGIPAALAGFTGAAVLGYFLTRLVSRDRIEQAIAEHPKARAVREALVGRGYWRTLGVITLLRLPPNSPFSITNLVLAGSGVPLAVFVPGTLLGMAPRTAVFVGFAAAASRNSNDIGEFIREGPGLRVMLLGIAMMIGVLMLLAHISNKAIERVVGRGAPGCDHDEPAQPGNSTSS